MFFYLDLRGGQNPKVLHSHVVGLKTADGRD